MKKFNASDLSKQPSNVWKAAREGGAIIQHKDRKGDVVEEFVINSRYEPSKKGALTRKDITEMYREAKGDL